MRFTSGKKVLYVVCKTGENPDVVLVASGSESHFGGSWLNFFQERKGITAQIVSRSLKVCRHQPQAYQEQVLVPANTEIRTDSRFIRYLKAWLLQWPYSRCKPLRIPGPR